MEKNLRPVNLIMKVDSANKDTRSLVIEAQEELEKFDDPWVGVSFQHKGLEVIVFKDSDVEDIVQFVETMSPEHEHAQAPTVQHAKPIYLGEELVLYVCLPQHSTFLNPN